MFKIELSMKTYDDFIILIIKIILESGKKMLFVMNIIKVEK